MPRTPREIALLIDFSLAGYDMMNGAVDFSRQHELAWSFQFLSPSVESSWQILEENKVDGIIIHATDEEMIDNCEALNVPWVNVSAKLDPLPRVSVTMDNRAIGLLAAETCSSMKGMHPALVSMEGMSFSRERGEGFLQGLGDAQPVSIFQLPALGLYRQPDVSWESVEQELGAFLSELETPSFVYCVNDEAALLVLNMAQRVGLSIPQDLCLLGVDNRAAQLGAQFNRISSIDVSPYSLSLLAAKMIHETGSDEGLLPDCIESLPPVGVVHRQSTRHLKTDDPVIDRAIDIVHSSSPWDQLNVAKLAEKSGCSRRYLEKRFQSEFNCTPKTYIEDTLLVRARHLLANTQISLSQVVEQTGFSDLRQMNAAFGRHHDTTAAGYRKRYLH